ncbi:MAG: hypothetical protein JW750_01330 [Anaerolineaceae bacterium]|nr:hypothetical protein [Anaerolineaceae bacterium]
MYYFNLQDYVVAYEKNRFGQVNDEMAKEMQYPYPRKKNLLVVALTFVLNVVK